MGSAGGEEFLQALLVSIYVSPKGQFFYPNPLITHAQFYKLFHLPGHFSNKVFSLRGKYDDVKTGVHAPVKVAGITESEPVATISKTESAPEAPVEPAPEAPVESAPEAPVEPTPEAPAADAQASE